MQLAIPSAPRDVLLWQIPGALRRVAIVGGLTAVLTLVVWFAAARAQASLSAERDFLERAQEVKGQVTEVVLPPMESRLETPAKLRVIYKLSGRDYAASGLQTNSLDAEQLFIGSKVALLVDPAAPSKVQEARWLEAHGADAIIAQGFEAGGHRGMFLSGDVSTQLATLALLPQILRAVRVPVIAAGGIADAAGVAAMLSLGAAAVQVGTAYLLCDEATTSAPHRVALQSDAAAHTALTNVFTGRPARGIMNRVMRELGPLSTAAPEFPLATAAMAPLRAACEKRGSGDFSPLWAGQNASGCRNIGAADMTRLLAP